MIFTHLFACIWCFVATTGNNYDSWISNKGLQDESGNRIYLFAFYWSVTTMFTVGFGDIVPHTNCIFIKFFY